MTLARLLIRLARRVLIVGRWRERVFDVAVELVDCLGELGDGLQCAVLAPMGDSANFGRQIGLFWTCTKSAETWLTRTCYGTGRATLSNARTSARRSK